MLSTRVSTRVSSCVEAGEVYLLINISNKPTICNIGTISLNNFMLVNLLPCTKLPLLRLFILIISFHCLNVHLTHK